MEDHCRLHSGCLTIIQAGLDLFQEMQCMEGGTLFRKSPDTEFARIFAGDHAFEDDNGLLIATGPDF